MFSVTRISFVGPVLLVFPLAVTAADVPPAAKTTVDFQRHIKPLLQRHCAKCHSGETRKGGFSINTRRTILDGSESNTVVVVGNSAKSELIERVAETDPDLRMPPKGEQPLSAKQVGLLRAWIDQGLKWQEGFAFGRLHRQARLEPRKVALPQVPGVEHPVDRLLQPYWKRHGFKAERLVSDRLFARRVWLDLVGLLPPVEELDRFLRDRRPDRRARLVERLLADRKAYAAHWMTWWNDLLRNNYRGTGYIDGGRKQITGWLYASLYDNKPYDRFVGELITGENGAAGFIRGIKWRGTVNDSQRREMQAAQNVAQVFLGTNLKCASCHDSFVNQWKLKQAYAFASVFAEKPLELHRCNKPTGKLSKVAFLYPQLGTIDPSADLSSRLKQLRRIITSPKDGRLSRTIVNRLWARFFGAGIVEPPDDMDQQPWDQDLLDWLAADLAEHGYDLKRTMRLICTSRAYRLPSVVVSRPDARNSRAVGFRGPLVKRLSAEQFADAVSQLTGRWPQPTRGMLRRDGRGQGGQLAAIAPALPSKKSDAPRVRVSAQWIWNDRKARQAAPAGERLFLRKTLRLKTVPRHVSAAVVCDDSFTLYVNGKRAGSGNDWHRPAAIELTRYLKKGENVIAADVRNAGNAPNPAGFFCQIAGFDAAKKPVWLVGSDRSWLVGEKPAKGWNRRQFNTRGWKHAAELAGATGGPWNIAARLRFSAGAGVPDVRVRAVFTDTDALLTALGRPNREQVVTRRDSVATTLQFLELTNGDTLDAQLKAGAAKWLSRHKNDPGKLIDQLYRTAFGRPPVEAERRVAREILGGKPTAENVQDLLWIVTMLPEFQLVR